MADFILILFNCSFDFIFTFILLQFHLKSIYCNKIKNIEISLYAISATIISVDP